MQDRMCGRCDCVLRAGKIRKTTWYKEPPSRFQGIITFSQLHERGEGNPDGDVWIIATASKWADRETEEAKKLRRLFSDDSFSSVHQDEHDGVVGLHPQIVVKGVRAKFWQTLLGIDASGKPRPGRGLLWDLWREGRLFVTYAVKCFVSGPVPPKNLELFAENCEVHLEEQFAGTTPPTVILAGEIPQRQYSRVFLKGEAIAEGGSSNGDSLVLPVADPEEKGAATAWKRLEKELRTREIVRL